MTEVLILAATPPPQPALLTEALQRFRDKGATVHVACHFDTAELPVDPALAKVHGFAAGTGGRRFRKRVRRAVTPSRRVWLRAHHDDWVRGRARRADVLVALDQGAVHAVWEFAHRHPGADARYGVAPSLKAVDARLAGRRPGVWLRLRRTVVSRASIAARGVRRWAIWAVRGTARRATGPGAMRYAAVAHLWTLAVSLPGIPDRVRSKATGRVHASMLAAGRHQAAARACAGAAKRTRSAERRADLLVSGATAQLQAAQVPANLGEAIAAQLAVADAHLKKKAAAKAAKALSRAWTLASNRVLHFDRLTSPLVEDPAKWNAPFRRSAAARAVCAPRGRATPAATPPPDRPHRLLLATYFNDNFLREIRERYENTSNMEVRFLDVYADPATRPLARGGTSIMEHALAGGRSTYGNKVEEWLRPHLDWADTVFIDWCSTTAAMFTLQDPRDTRIVVRLHSFEAFIFWPHVVDFSRVDDVVFVSDHLRDLSVAAIPHLTGDGGPRLSVISNAMDLRRFPRPKPDSARFTLGLVGFSAVAKDPSWAIEVLRELRAHDERFTLTLIGSDLDPNPSEAARRYDEQFQADLAELEPTGAVRRLGQTADVPGALTDVGVILSSSVRESFHCGLVEGAASGAVPVVRDWPFFAGEPHGARSLFPADWVVDSPKEAAARILAVTATEESWRAAGQAASEHAIATWDWTVVAPEFDRLFLGTDRH